MNQIFVKVRDVNANDSDAVKEVLSSFFHKLPKYTEIDNRRWLQTLENIINRFPKFCTTHRPVIETYLTNFLERDNQYQVILAAKCAHALQQVKPSQDKAVSPQACWREQMVVLCHAAHLLIDELFGDSVNIHRNNPIEQISIRSSILYKTPLTKALITKKVHGGDEGMSKRDYQTIKLRNILIFIQAMLVEIYPVAKPVRPQIIFEVIVQILSATGNTEHEKSPAGTRLKIEGLQTVNALIACLGSNLIPFSALVFRYIMQTLRWSSLNSSEGSRKIRRAAYNSLCKWLRVLHVHKPSQEGGGQLWEDEMTKNILDDITPQRKVIQLTMSPQANKKLSKKAKRKLEKTMLRESAIASHMPGEKNKMAESEVISDDVAIAALKFTETFLTVCGIFLKPTTHLVLQERLVRDCYALATYSSERGLWLLRALESARKAVPPGVAPPTQYCLHIYSGLLNHQGEIQMLCSQALLDIRMHLHCSPPSLNFVMDVPLEGKKKPESKRKFISERNRTVLESLLGAERMPMKDIEEDSQDVISIPDEPLIKKPRLEDNVTDRISLSSESVQSLQISDDSTDESIVFEAVEPIIQYRKENEDAKPASESEMEKIHSNPDMENFDESLNPSTTEVSNDIEKPHEDVNKLTEEQENEFITTPVSKDKNEEEKGCIHEAETQIPLNISTEDTIDDDERPLSMEVAYDYQKTGKEAVTVLDVVEDENIPSSNESEDVQITCGQQVKDSQSESIKNSERLDQEVENCNGDENADYVENGMSEELVAEHKENGMSEEPINENMPADIEASVDISLKTVDKSEAITVEDMLADFVDEVKEDSQTEA